jgi:ribonuclease HI
MGRVGALCKEHLESVDHIFMHCSYAREVWSISRSLKTTLRRWQGNSFEVALQEWLCARGSYEIKDFPLIIAWGIWIARNRAIFHDEYLPTARVVANSIGIMDSLSCSGGEGLVLTRSVREEIYDNSRPWGYFDGAASVDHLLCGGGGCLYLSSTHHYTLKVGLGAGTNNYSELMALKLLLLFVVEQGCQTLQVFGDSLIIINWENGVHRCHISRLVPILEDVMHIKSFFDSISFTHIYRERNQLADRLSKEVAQLAFGQWYIEEQTVLGTHGFYHRPFHEIQDIDLFGTF